MGFQSKDLKGGDSRLVSTLFPIVSIPSLTTIYLYNESSSSPSQVQSSLDNYIDLFATFFHYCHCSE